MERWTLHWSRLQQLDIPTITSVVPGAPGVYRLSYKSTDGNFYVFYVGRADLSLRQRLFDHLSERESNLCIKRFVSNYECYFRYALVQSAQVREGAERNLFRKYLPQCNFQEPEGPDIEINYE